MGMADKRFAAKMHRERNDGGVECYRAYCGSGRNFSRCALDVTATL